MLDYGEASQEAGQGEDYAMDKESMAAEQEIRNWKYFEATTMYWVCTV